MVRIKILEDDPADRDTLIECLRKYEREQGQNFSITAYDNPSDFMDNYHMDADLIFMDIELPGINGIETAHQLRAADPVAALVFITNMEQYAINGYEVDALDFVIKPINYYRFSSMMLRALRNLPVRDEKEIILQAAGTIRRMRISQIYYVEIQDHLLLYHTDMGRIEAWANFRMWRLNWTLTILRGAAAHISSTCSISHRYPKQKSSLAAPSCPSASANARRSVTV